MSKKDAVPLHIEWTPGWVRAVNIATGERAEGVTLKQLGQIINGHKQALVGIGRKIVFLKSVRLPKAMPDDLRRIIGVQLPQFFPLPASQLSFDFIQTSNQTQEGLLTLIAAMRSEDLSLLQNELKEVGLTAQRILPIALASAVVAAKSGKVDALIVEIDRGDIALDVVLGGFLRFSRVAPAGSDLMTESKRTLAAANAGELPMLVCGNTAPPGSAPSPEGTLGHLHETPNFDFELAESRVLHVKQRIASRTRFAVLAVLLAIALIAVVWSQRISDQALLQQAKARYSEQIRDKQAADSEAESNATQLLSLETDLNHAFEPGQRLSDISAFVSDSLPSGAWLTGLSVERAKQLQVRGTAMSSGAVADFVDKLGSNSRFANVKLIFANSALIGTTPVIQFNVSADCVGNLPMPSASKDVSYDQTASSSSTESTEGS